MSSMQLEQVAATLVNAHHYRFALKHLYRQVFGLLAIRYQGLDRAGRRGRTPEASVVACVRC